MDNADADFLVGDFLQALLDGFGRALHIRLDDDGQLLHIVGSHLVKQVIQRDLGVGGKLLFLRLGGAAVRQLTGKALVLDRLKQLACFGDLGQTGDLHRGGGTCLGDLLTLVVAHGTHTTHGGTGDQAVALMQGAVLHQQRGDGTLTLVQTRFYDSALAAAVGVRLQLHNFGFQRDALQQVADAHTGQCRNGDAGNVAAPILGYDLVLGQLFLDALRVGGGLIHLVDGNDQLDVGSLGVVDGLDGLGHNAVVRSDDQHGDIGHIGAAGAHGGERLVTRGVQEGDQAVAALDLIRADGLGNAAGFALGDVGLADGVQNGGLAVVNVTHNDNDRRTLDEILGVVLLLHEQALLDGNMDLMLDLGVEFLGDQGGGVEIDHVGNSVHLAHRHKLGNDLGGALLQAGSQLADGDLIGDGNFQLGIARLFQLDALQALRLGFAAATELLTALAVAVVELFLFAGGLVLALAGHIAAVRQIIIAGVEFIHVDVHGAGVNGNARAVDLHLLGGGNGLFDAGVGCQFLEGDALFTALLRLLFGLAGFLLGFLRLGGGLCLGLRLCLFLGRLLFCLGGGLRLRLRLGLCLGAVEVGIHAGFGIGAGQGFQQDIQLLLAKGAAGLIGFARQGGDGFDNFFCRQVELLGNIGNLILKIHRV